MNKLTKKELQNPKRTMQELKNSIRGMQEIVDDPEVPDSVKEHIPDSIKEAKRLLAELEAAQQNEHKAATAKGPDKAVKRTIAKQKTKKVQTAAVQTIHAFLKKSKALRDKYKGTSAGSLETDAGIKAKKPGSRTSAAGNTYREYRANRTDINRKKYPYLEDGGAVEPGAGSEKEIIIPEELPAQSNNIDVFGYQTKHFTKDAAAAFNKAVEEIRKDEGQEGLYFHNTSTALKEYAQLVDEIFEIQVRASSGEPISSTTFISAIDKAIKGAIYNYKSGFYIDPAIARNAITNMSGLTVNRSSFADGGTIPFMADGTQVTLIGERLSADREKMENKDFYDSLMEHINDTGEVVSSTFAIANVKFSNGEVIPISKSYLSVSPKMERGGDTGDKNEIPYKVDPKYKWYAFDEKNQKIAARFKSRKEFNKHIEDLAKKNPAHNLVGYSGSYLKRIQFDASDKNNWAKEGKYLFGGVLYVRSPDNFNIAHGDYTNLDAVG
jgi:hypothetical protein